MRLGLTSYTLRWAVGGDFRFGDKFRPEKPLDAFDLVDKVSALGLGVLQIADNVSLDLTAQEYRRLGEAAKRKGIALQLGAEGISRSVVEEHSRTANLIGCSLLNLYAAKREPVETIAVRIRRFLPFLRDHELTMTLENEDSGIYSCHELADILSQVNDPLVRACIDTMNSAVILENPLETVKALAPSAVCIHLKDFTIKRESVSGFTVFGTPVGKGMLDVKAVLNMVTKAGRNPDILLEQFMGRRGNEAETLKEEERWMKEGIRFMRQIM
jgi:sugar phosphate isomerase/epimerase